MTIPILTTKLHVPTPQATLVSRPRLTEQLESALRYPLTLLSAAAGSGKTTLLSGWLATSGHSVAWLSLDERDSDPQRFLMYLVAALQTLENGIGQTVMDALKANPLTAPESLLTILLNDLLVLQDDALLVLDDYHLVDDSTVDDALAFFIQHMPPQLHLVIATREDPQLPLARLRVRGQLQEIRASDLRFTVDEVTHFLNTAMGLTLSSADVAALEARTEGWIAGLQLAALSMQGRSDTSDFIAAFTGSHRFVVDYLIEEVLGRQSDDRRNFLLQTAMLDQLNGALCDAVTGGENSQSILENLERDNLFVVPLDGHRQWYRYHHLFAEALRNTLIATQPDLVHTLHRRACDWYAASQQSREAIHHALAAKDYERAADLIELTWQNMETNYESASWIHQVKRLPDEIIQQRPVLCVGYGWTMIYRGEFESSERWFQRAEYWLYTDERAAMRVADEFQFEMLPASLSSARAYRAMARGDLQATFDHAQQAIALVGDADHSSRTQAMALSGLAQWAKGDLTAADERISALIDYMQTAGRIADAVELMFIVGDIRMTCGKLRSAYSLYQRGFELLNMAEGATLVGMEDLYRGVVAVYREWGDWNAAEDHLMAAEEFGAQAISRPDWPHRLNLTAARLKLSQGELDAALALAETAQRHYSPSPIPPVRSAESVIARIWIKQGNLSAAAGWVRDHAPDDITYLTEFDHITHARLLLAQGNKDAAQALLKRLLVAAESNGRTGSAIEILILQALGHYAHRERSVALEALAKALRLAESEGYVRLFADEGAPMADLLQEAIQYNIASQYAQRLLDNMGGTSSSTPMAQPLIDPLSERELDVLRLLRTELSGPEIAHELIISLNTFRTHSKNIYSKLGVNSRRSAVRRAVELNLL